MKNTKAIVAVMSLSLLAAGCGDYSKSPVADLEQMRANGKSEIQAGPEKVRERIVEVKVKEDGTVVTVEQAKIGNDSIVVSPQLDMTFSEGASASFPITTKVLVPGVGIKLVVSGLPDGATVTESTTQPGTYMLTWAPPFYTIPAGQSAKTIIATADVQIVSGDAEKVKALKALDLSKKFALTIVPTNQAPSEQTVSGLTSEIVDGTITEFSVTVKVPGVDDKSAEKPELMVIYDGQSSTEGNNFLEMDGTRHIGLDLAKKSREYVGDYKWKFNRIFDTKNVNAAPQLGKDGKVIANYSGTRVRFTVKVIGGRNMSTPAQVVQVKILRNAPIEAPRFDLSGLNAQALEVARGQEVSVSFNVASADAAATVKMEGMKTSLPGAPKMNCQVSSGGTATQNCVLTWKVPCDTQDAKLNGDINMSAYAVVEGRNSQATAYTLKVVAAKEDKKLCAEVAAKAPEAKAEEAKATEVKTTETKATDAKAKDTKAKDTKAKDTKAKDVKAKDTKTPAKKTPTTTKKTTDKKETK